MNFPDFNTSETNANTAPVFENETGVSIGFLVNGWFCKVGGCGKEGTVTPLFP